jgi:hypothetical protein
MPDELYVKTIDVGLSSTVVQLFKLQQQMIDYLWERIDIAKKKKSCHKRELAGHISQSYKLDDPQNLVIQNLYKIVNDPGNNPKMFEFIQSEVTRIYDKTGLYGMLIPHLESIWVNFQKKGEFQPIHNHGGIFSFVIWMDIPYHCKDEAKLPSAKTSCKDPPGGNFTFVTANGINRGMNNHIIQMTPEMNGYCCFFPSDLTHQVYPFYTSDKDRITISGNISYRPKESSPPQVYQFPFHTSET